MSLDLVRRHPSVDLADKTLTVYIVAIKNDHIWKKSSSKDKNHLNLFKQAAWIKYLPRQGCISQLFWSFADPSQVPLGVDKPRNEKKPPEFSTLVFVLVRDSVPSPQVLEHCDQLDQEPHSQSTGNIKFHYIGVKWSYFWFAKHLNWKMEFESWNIFQISTTIKTQNCGELTKLLFENKYSDLSSNKRTGGKILSK